LHCSGRHGDNVHRRLSLTEFADQDIKRLCRFAVSVRNRLVVGESVGIGAQVVDFVVIVVVHNGLAFKRVVPVNPGPLGPVISTFVEHVFDRFRQLSNVRCSWVFGKIQAQLVGPWVSLPLLQHICPNSVCPKKENTQKKLRLRHRARVPRPISPFGALAGRFDFGRLGLVSP